MRSYHLQTDIHIYHLKQVRHLIQNTHEWGRLSHNVRRRSVSGDESVAVDESRKAGDVLETLRLRPQKSNFVSPHIPRDTPQKIPFIPSFCSVLPRGLALSEIAQHIEISTKASKQKDFRIWPKVPKNGADGESRTLNLRITNALLCHWATSAYYWRATHSHSVALHTLC